LDRARHLRLHERRHRLLQDRHVQRLIRLKHAIDRSWANIDVLLKQRHDELPKLVETVKGYMAHEKEVLTRVTEARAAVQSAGSMDEKSRADGELRGALSRLFAVAEN
jgi:LemA protein